MPARSVLWLSGEAGKIRRQVAPDVNSARVLDARTDRTSAIEIIDAIAIEAESGSVAIPDCFPLCNDNLTSSALDYEITFIHEMSEFGRYCCKSLFGVANENS
jgi:hypothetical protein